MRLDVAAGLAFVMKELAPFLAEYHPPRHSTDNPRDFYLDNGFYEGIDAELLYAMVRRYAPPRILELGAGMSTLVIADARARNDAQDDGWHIVCDPHPRADLLRAMQGVAEVRPLKATAVPRELFAELQAGDLLFVDTTHTVKIDSDVNRIILEVLPRLAPGVFVHIHDIFLPWEYPREFLTERRFFWSEQYLLQAFLAFNYEYEILCPAHALQRTYPAEMARLVPSTRPDTRPGALWLRRTGE